MLLALVVFNILVLPLLDEGMGGDLLGRIFYSLLFIECADILRRTGRYYRTGLVLSALALGFGWMVPVWPGPWTYLLQFLFAGTLLFFHAIRLVDAARPGGRACQQLPAAGAGVDDGLLHGLQPGPRGLQRADFL